MHVLIVNQYALPAGSAGITRHGDLGRELVERGHRVTVIASQFNYLTRSTERASDREVLDGVTFRWLETGAYSGNDAGRTRSMLAFMVRSALEGARMRPRPDVVIGSSPQLLAGLSALAIARWFSVPFLFEVRDPWPSALVDLGALRPESLANRGLERIERLLYRSADRIIAVMEHIDRRVDEVGEDPAKCVFIPNASRVPPALGEVPEALATDFRLEAEGGRTIVLYAGAHGVSNGLRDVLAALDQLHDQDPEAYEALALFFVGDGPEKAGLQRAAEQRGHRHVQFHGSVPKPAMVATMAAADFLLVHFAGADFKRYGMSANKLFDAMAVGTPVLLATPLTDTPVDTVKCGIRYEPGSAKSLAAALAAAVRTSRGQRQAMGERGQTEARRRYDLRVTGAQLEELLFDVLG